MFASSARRIISASASSSVPAVSSSSRSLLLPTVSAAASRSVRASPFTTSSSSSLLSLNSSSRSHSSFSSTSWAFLASLGVGAALLAAPLTVQAEEAKKHNGLDPNDFKKITLKEIRPYNHNSNVYVFALDDPRGSLDLPVTSYVLTRFQGEDGKPVVRPYTPIDPDAKGVLNLLVKEYPAGVMSKHIANLKPGDELEIKGPLPKFPYIPNQFQHVGLIAGGTGLTPCLQLIESILNNPKDHTKISFVFANTSVKDILLKEQLDAYARRYPSQFRVIYVIDRKEVDWQGEVGYVSRDIIDRYIPGPNEEGIKVFICGPPAFYNTISGPKAKDYTQGEVGGHLATLGYSKDKVFKF